MPESLKNILLVMHNGGVLVPPQQNPAKAHFWKETWLRIDRFMPGMKQEIFPPADASSAAAAGGDAGPVPNAVADGTDGMETNDGEKGKESTRHEEAGKEGKKQVKLEGKRERRD